MVMLKDSIKRNSENSICSCSILKYCTYRSCRLAAITMKMEQHQIYQYPTSKANIQIQEHQRKAE